MPNGYGALQGEGRCRPRTTSCSPSCRSSTRPTGRARRLRRRAGDRGARRQPRHHPRGRRRLGGGGTSVWVERGEIAAGVDPDRRCSRSAGASSGGGAAGASGAGETRTRRRPPRGACPPRPGPPGVQQADAPCRLAAPARAWRSRRRSSSGRSCSRRARSRRSGQLVTIPARRPQGAAERCSATPRPSTSTRIAPRAPGRSRTTRSRRRRPPSAHGPARARHRRAGLHARGRRPGQPSASPRCGGRRCCSSSSRPGVRTAPPRRRT